MSERRPDSERETLNAASDDGPARDDGSASDDVLVRGRFTAEVAEGRGGRGGDQGAVGGMGRREALKVLATSAVALPLAGSLAACSPDNRTLPVVDASKAPAGGVDASGVPVAGPRGTRSDPDLLNPKVSWPMLLTASEMVTLTALCDMIIPADDKSPAASAVGVPAYINEYVSAPAEWYQKALVQVRGGLIWINVESNKRFGKPFAEVISAQRTAICDDICYAAKARPEFKQAAQFFDRVRDLTAEGFYTTDEGMKDIGYVGNVALASFDGPPPEVLKHLGLA